eukprot:198045_1
MTKHSKELSILNTFQKMIQNQSIKWNDNKQHVVKALAWLITDQLNKVSRSGFGITEYGRQLFEHFCEHVSDVCIKTFECLPTQLSNVLFIDYENRFSFIPISKLFPNLSGLTLCELDLQQMTFRFSSGKLMDVVLEMIKNTIVTKNEKLEKIEFISKQQTYHKQNHALKETASRYFNNISQYKWKAKYQCRTDNTHTMTFTNNNVYAKSNTRKSSNSTSSISNIYPSKQNQSLSYFMQITNIDDDNIRVVVTLRKHHNKKQKCYIKELHEMKFEQKIVFVKHQTRKEIDIEIKDHNGMYHLALYESTTAKNPLPESNQLCFEILKSAEINSYYKPNCIDLSTVLKCKANGELKIYWSVPTKLYGEIAYYVVNNATKDSEKITLLPYCIPLSQIPLSFKVITVVTEERDEIEDQIYKSETSKTISCDK